MVTEKIKWKLKRIYAWNKNENKTLKLLEYHYAEKYMALTAHIRKEDVKSII